MFVYFGFVLVYGDVGGDDCVYGDVCYEVDGYVLFVYCFDGVDVGIGVGVVVG